MPLQRMYLLNMQLKHHTSPALSSKVAPGHSGKLMSFRIVQLMSSTPMATSMVMLWGFFWKIAQNLSPYGWDYLAWASLCRSSTTIFVKHLFCTVSQWQSATLLSLGNHSLKVSNDKYLSKQLTLQIFLLWTFFSQNLY